VWSEGVSVSTDKDKKVENVPVRDNATAKKFDATGSNPAVQQI
jgi:hypothetical protein